MPKTKIILAVVGTLVLVGGMIAGVLVVLRNQELRRQAAPATSLAIIPATQSKNPGQTLSLSVKMDTGANKVTGIDLVLSFNAQVFEVTSVTKGSGLADFTQEFNKLIDNTAGKITFSTFTIESAKAVQGSSIEAFIISGKVKGDAASGTYNFTFASGTVVAGVLEGQNVLVGTTPGVVTVGAGGPTATPTTPPAGSPTATPIRTPTPTAGIGGGYSATATPTPTRTPTPTASPTEPPIPETGTSLPTLLGIGVGFMVILFSFALAAL